MPAPFSSSDSKEKDVPELVRFREIASLLSEVKIPDPEISEIDKAGTQRFRNAGGAFHRIGGPAVIYPSGHQEWWENGKRHRTDGPAILSHGNSEWFLNGLKHRIGGPAKITSSGDKFWYVDNRLHREDGPAIEYTNGSKKYFINGQMHRIDGPAHVHYDPDGNFISAAWWWKGQPSSKEKIEALVKRGLEKSNNSLSSDKKMTDNNSHRNSELKPIPTQSSNTSPKPLIQSPIQDLQLIGLAIKHCNAKGFYHRDNGPAVIYPNGVEEWWQFGKLHRVNGPAVTYSPNNSRDRYFWFGEEKSKIDYEKVLFEFKKLVSDYDNQFSTPTLLKEVNDTTNEIVSLIEKTSTLKKEEIKEWPSDPEELIEFDKIWEPFKNLLEEGYRLIRKTDIKGFKYTGYDLSKPERKYFTSLSKQFTEKCLEEEFNKNKRSLLDVVMRAMFLMGIEQGRRITYGHTISNKKLRDKIEFYRRHNQELKYELDKMEAILNIKTNLSHLSPEDQEEQINIALENTRQLRIEEIKKDLLDEPIRPAFSGSVKKKIKLSDLIEIAKTLDPDIVKLDDWKKLLEHSKLSFQDWYKFCKKNKFLKYI